MNVIVANEKQELLNNLNIEILKTEIGVFSADDIVDKFSNFFFGRMVFDVTALDGYKDPKNFQKISISLDTSKIILLLSDIPECKTPTYISKLISMGFYNFTTDVDGITYLLSNPNSYRDVAHLHQLENSVIVGQPENNNNGSGDAIATWQGQSKIIAFKNLTEGAGSTTLTYLLHKELKKNGYNSIAIEINKRDFMYLNDKELVSINAADLAQELIKYRSNPVVLVDINDYDNMELFTDIIYLFEPSFIKLNKLMLRDRNIFSKLAGKKIILNRCMLSEKDIRELEYEAKIKFYMTIPNLDDRMTNIADVIELKNKLGL